MVDRNRLLTEVNRSLLGLYCTVLCGALQIENAFIFLKLTSECFYNEMRKLAIWTKVVLIGGCYPDNILTFLEIGFSILLFVHAEIFGFATFGVPLSGGVIALAISSNLL